MYKVILNGRPIDIATDMETALQGLQQDVIIKKKHLKYESNDHKCIGSWTIAYSQDFTAIVLCWWVQSLSVKF